jgi:aspartate racemase
MKKLGIIGGIGPESTIEYYKQIIKEFQVRLNSNDYPEMILNSINMTQMLNYISENRLDHLINFLIEKIEILKKSKVDFVIIASNTPHIVFNELNDRVNIPLISIVEETCKTLKKNNVKRVGLFGTKFTMSNGFYNKAAEKYGIEIIVPDKEKQDFIHDKYMNELIFNRIYPETKSELIRFATDIQSNEQIEGLILGGTELPLILNQFDFNEMKIFDTTKIHVESIVSKMIEE